VENSLWKTLWTYHKTDYRMHTYMGGPESIHTVLMGESEIIHNVLMKINATAIENV